MNTFVLFFFGIVLGVLVTMSFMSRMAGDGSISASVAEDHEKRHKKLNHQFTHQLHTDGNSPAELDPSSTTSATSATGATSATSATSATESNFQVDADIDRWANEVMDVIGTKGKSQKASAAAQRAPASASASAAQKPDATKSTKKKVSVSPLDSLARDIKYVPDSDGSKPKARGRGDRNADKLAATAAAAAARERQTSIRASGNAEKARIEAREKELAAAVNRASAPTAKAAANSDKSVNFDTKTDARGRDNNDDLIVGGGSSATGTGSLKGSVGDSSSTGSISKRGPAAAASTALVKYHAVARSAAPAVNIVSIDSLTAAGRTLPDMSRQHAAYEKENLKLHLCNAVFEAYSASYLTTKKHMMDVKSESYNLTWVNCEMASFIHMRESRNFVSNAMGDGMIIQSLDVLDFSVIHLSAFERSSKKHKHLLWKSRKDLQSAWHNIDPVKETSKILDNLNNPKNPKSTKIVHSEEAKKTVVVMPFLGGAMGAGHSELGNRFDYLRACFWSFYEFVPNIVAGVTRQADVDWIMKESGMPFYDVILLENLPKSASLPVATTQQVKQRLVSGKWDFDYVFFTESDQILISRELPLMYEHLKKYPDRMLLPHRLMPYSDRAIKEVHKRNIDNITGKPTGEALVDNKKGLAIGPNDWQKQSCCMERQNCAERKTWKHISDPEVPIINYHGLFVPLGNINFLAESYRYCKIGPYTDICP